MNMHYIRRGTGKPLLLVHGIGGSWRSWNPILEALAAEREVIAVDLPGFGDTPPLPGPVTIGTLADALTEFLRAHNFLGIDAVGSSMGARLVLEMARRGGVLGAVVSLDPGGFWRGWEIPFFYYTVAGSIRLVRALQPVMPALTGSAVGRTALFAQFSARPWRLSPKITLDEMRTFAASPSFDELLDNLAHGEKQQGAPKGSIAAPLVIGWGRQDLVCLPGQAARAQALFPDARLHWFDTCGHFPQWDQPQETTRLILQVTGGQYRGQEAGAEAVSRPPRTLAVAAVAGLAVAGLWLLVRRAR
ncbi:alpha/beta fold hydrolase [Hymenobacter sp. BT730]|uniref:alpha/beta fold hydrolase n=1 Tax=Hymenobacter sp. BT730 TaxID=3063332 RepID=UPI0026E09F5F|nr:alpha/beta fold hydrolase [Hymenobacter sp. BT730]